MYQATATQVKRESSEVTRDTILADTCDSKDWHFVQGVTSSMPSVNCDTWESNLAGHQSEELTVTATSQRKNKRKPFAPKRYMDHSSNGLLELSEYGPPDIQSVNPSGHHLQCLMCQEKFNTYPELVCHTSTVHQLSVDDDENAESINQMSPFKTAEFLPTTAHPTITETATRSAGTSPDTRYPCRLCASSFSKPGALKEHMNYAHDKYKAFPCSMCSAKFFVRSHLRSHMKVHSPRKEIVCAYCEKRFNYMSNMKSHVQLVHERDKIVKMECEFCARAFNTASNLRQHIKAIHLRQLPYVCSVCCTGFWTKMAVASHKCSGVRVADELLDLAQVEHTDSPTQVVSQGIVSQELASQV